jgi:hypothetical protein
LGGDRGGAAPPITDDPAPVSASLNFDDSSKRRYSITLNGATITYNASGDGHYRRALRAA